MEIIIIIITTIIIIIRTIVINNQALLDVESMYRKFWSNVATRRMISYGKSNHPASINWIRHWYNWLVAAIYKIKENWQHFL